VRNTPIALLRRKNFALWSSVFPQPAPTATGEFSTTTQTVYDYLATRGASFFTDIVDSTKLLRSQVEEALAELVANGVVVSDSFAGLRALLTPGSRKTQAAARRKHRQPVYEMASAGRWSILQRNGAVQSANEATLTEEVAWALLKRYGVVFKRLLEREGMALPWRVLLRFYHRLEARGDIRGGRFVAGISGEQFALPEAIGMLRAIRRAGAQESLISVSAADPLNLVGIIVPGSRITAHTSNRILYHDGAPIAALESGETRFLVELSRAMEWKAKAALVRKATRPELRSYLQRPA
jgi:ATP-dependent Lhr-like helicase